MAWIGWQAGMTGAPVEAAKKTLKRKFTYAQSLDDTPFFDWALQAVLITYQKKKNATAYQPKLREDGVLDYATQVALGIIPAPKQQKVGTLFTVHGTGQADPLGPGYPADVARAVLDVWDWQPIGNYPAAAFPMNPSVMQGRAELKLQIRNHPGKFGLVGYSQGAMITAMTFKHDLLNPQGELHDRLPDLIASVTWGNPCREQGVAHGNRQEGIPIPEGPGISDDRLVDTPDWWYDYAHGGNCQYGKDIYTDTSEDENIAEHMTSIFRLVQKTSGFVGPNGLLEQITEIIKNPLIEVPAVFRAIYFGGAFITAKPFATAPHCNYRLEPAINYLRSFRRL